MCSLQMLSDDFLLRLCLLVPEQACMMLLQLDHAACRLRCGEFRRGQMQTELQSISSQQYKETRTLRSEGKHAYAHQIRIRILFHLCPPSNG